LIDREDVCSFDNIVGDGKKLAVYCDRQEAAGTTITLQYTNSGGQFVTSVFNGQQIDGERIALPAAGTYAYSANTVAPGGLMQVYKDVTVGMVRLYEFDPATSLLKPLGYYAPDEEVPIYRSSEIPGFKPSATSTTCTGTPVEVRAKIRFIPVVEDDDFLVISLDESIRLAAQGVLKEENSKFSEADKCFATALRLLDSQLKHWRGSGTVTPVVFRDGHLPAVRNII
jgi:hypothetical protein